jgi:hypothetical protein
VHTYAVDIDKCIIYKEMSARRMFMVYKCACLAQHIDRFCYSLELLSQAAFNFKWVTPV